MLPGSLEASPSFQNSPAIRRPDALHVGLCGVGRSGLGMVRRDLATSPFIHVAAAFDVLPERAAQLASLCGFRVCGSFDEILADDSLDLIIIATRSHEHLPMTLAALNRGRDVLVE